jgi:hypothetical protein
MAPGFLSESLKAEDRRGSAVSGLAGAETIENRGEPVRNGLLDQLSIESPQLVADLGLDDPIETWTAILTTFRQAPLRCGSGIFCIPLGRARHALTSSTSQT